MNKKTLILCLVATLCACRSISYQDVNPTINPNPNLLPALNIVVDKHNLESVYTAGHYTGWKDNNDDDEDNYSRVKGTFHKDERVNDVENIFEKEVTENITNPYGEKKGYITLKLGYRQDNSLFLYKTASLLSVFTLNLAGFPQENIVETQEVTVEILNNKKELIKRYTENTRNEEFSALYWGYNTKDMNRKVAATNIKEALEKIRNKINDDAAEIKKHLK